MIGTLQSNQTFSVVASITRNYAAIIRNSERIELSFGAISMTVLTKEKSRRTDRNSSRTKPDWIQHAAI